MGDLKIQKRYNEYLECLGENITDTRKVMESINKIVSEENFNDEQKLFLLGVILQRNGMEYIHALKKRATKAENSIPHLNKVIKEKNKEIERLLEEAKIQSAKLDKFREKNAELGSKAVQLQQQLDKSHSLGQSQPISSSGEKKRVIVVKKKTES